METLQVNIHKAKTQLSKLIQEALKGNEVIIARGNKPFVQLDVLPDVRGQRKIGNAKGLILSMADDFDEPLHDFREYMRISCPQEQHITICSCF